MFGDEANDYSSDGATKNSDAEFCAEFEETGNAEGRNNEKCSGSNRANTKGKGGVFPCTDIHHEYAEDRADDSNGGQNERKLHQH